MGEPPDSWDEDTTGTTLPTAAEIGPPRARPCLTVITGGTAGHVYKLVRGGGLIGRAPNAEIRIGDDGVSRKHAQVRHDAAADVHQIDDLGSRNGTYVNGVRVEATTTLKEGDKIQVGRTTVLRFGFHDALDESFHESLVSSALRDPLTRLYNKRYFLDRLDSELKFARRHETPLSLLMIDVDHFKKINDGHGHLAGDAVLHHLAGVLVKAVRNEDVVARFGGEELVIILRAIGLEAAYALGERLRRTVEATVIPHQSRELRATVSVGVAGFPSTKADTMEQLVEAADQALYRAKHGGRNRVAR